MITARDMAVAYAPPRLTAAPLPAGIARPFRERLLLVVLYVTVFASHDEFVHFHTDEPEAAERIQQSLVEAKVECSLEAGGTRKK